jgi:hypothetical protein
MIENKTSEWSKKEEFMATDKRMMAAQCALDQAQREIGEGNIWGEARRFAGARDGNKLARLDRARARLLREYTRAEKRYQKLQDLQQNRQAS